MTSTPPRSQGSPQPRGPGGALRCIKILDSDSRFNAAPVGAQLVGYDPIQPRLQGAPAGVEPAAGTKRGQERLSRDVASGLSAGPLRGVSVDLSEIPVEDRAEPAGSRNDNSMSRASSRCEPAASAGPPGRVLVP